MNSIIWKGVPSTTIEGLLISELPPISKPPLRVKETAIDGRDGSIIEELGYSSYDKSITIGLHGSFDINKVIKYFTGEGDIIFSNEPDKVYSAKIIGQIDYNRLLRFRTAVVSFRVQPFKHKYLEAYKEPQTATAEGTSIVVTDSANAILKSFSIVDQKNGNNNICVTVAGKNLLPPISVTDAFWGNGDGTYAVADTEKNTSIIGSVILEKDEQYTLSATQVSGSGLLPCLILRRTDGTNIISNYGNPSVPATVTPTKTETATVILQSASAKGICTKGDIFAVQFEIGSTATAFEPYKEPQTITASTEEIALYKTLKSNEPTTTITNDASAYMKVEYFKPFEVFNEGLENSKPIMVLKGSGTVGISVNGIHIFDYTFPEGETEVVIDSEKEDAYLGEVLKNRNMNGEFPILLSGTNKIEWSGYVESIEILPRSRWL